MGLVTLPNPLLAKLQDPAHFAKAVLGASLWQKQADILRSIWSNPKTAVKSCHSSGKTFLSAAATLAWVTNFPDGIVITTAPSWTQVKNALWGEIRRAAAGARIIEYPKLNQVELRLGEKNYAIGISTNESDRFQGFHSDHVLIILDEATGVKQRIWDGIIGIRAGGKVRLLAIGNPTVVGGQFHDAFTLSRSNWATHTISAFDTPNLRNCFVEYEEEGPDGKKKLVRVGRGSNLLEMKEEYLDKDVRPYLCTRRWVKEIFEEWGPHHPYWESRVLGEFPRQSESALISLAWLEAAKYRGMRLSTGEDKIDLKGVRPRAGLDVAGPGEDKTVLIVRVGPKVVLKRSWVQEDPRGEVIAALAPYQEDLEMFNIDSIGVGWGIYLHMKDIFKGKKCKVNPVNVGSASHDKKFVNLKAELYWGLRLQIQDGDFILAENLSDPETLIGQLAVQRYSHNAAGKIEIESKEDLRKRSVKSPDEAEACMLAFAEPNPSGEVRKIISVTRGDISGESERSALLGAPGRWRNERS